MAYKYDEHDAVDLSRIIRRRRPQWTQQGILKQLQLAAESGATIAQVTAAAEKAWMNKKADTPASILWAEHWESGAKALNISGTRVCTECNPARKYPVQDMRQLGPGIWICATCEGASSQEEGA